MWVINLRSRADRWASIATGLRAALLDASNGTDVWRPPAVEGNTLNMTARGTINGSQLCWRRPEQALALMYRLLLRSRAPTDWLKLEVGAIAAGTSSVESVTRALLKHSRVQAQLRTRLREQRNTKESLENAMARTQQAALDLLFCALSPLNYVYAQILGRRPKTGEMQAYTELLDRRQVSLSDIARALLLTVEYESLLQGTSLSHEAQQQRRLLQFRSIVADLSLLVPSLSDNASLAGDVEYLRPEAVYHPSPHRVAEPLRREEVAVALSHSKAWWHAYRERVSVLVLEDDTAVPAGLKGTLQALLSSLAPDFDVLLLHPAEASGPPGSKTCPSGKSCFSEWTLSHRVARLNVSVWNVRHLHNAGGYVITPSGAAKLLNCLPVREEVDGWLGGLSNTETVLGVPMHMLKYETLQPPDRVLSSLVLDFEAGVGLRLKVLSVWPSVVGSASVDWGNTHHDAKGRAQARAGEGASCGSHRSGECRRGGGGGPR